MDVEQLQHLHGNARKDARYDDNREPHLGVWHKEIKAHEDHRHEHIRQHVNRNAHDRAKHNIVVGLSRQRCNNDTNARRHHDDDRHKEKHGKIIGHSPIHATRVLNLPYRVERLFHIGRKH